MTDIPQLHLVPYPFVRETYEDCDEEGCGTTERWKPGARFDDGPDGVDVIADAVGSVEYAVVSRHKPAPGYPERVLYVRTWIDPDGQRFGKRRLLITTAGNFTRMLKGYRYPFDVAKKAVA